MMMINTAAFYMLLSLYLQYILLAHHYYCGGYTRNWLSVVVIT